MLEVLDTAGQEEYTALRDQWIRDGEGFVLVYSISSRSSFTRIRNFHKQIQRVKETCAIPSSYSGSPTLNSDHDSRYPVPIMLVGNKSDRVSEREVSTQERARPRARVGLRIRRGIRQELRQRRQGLLRCGQDPASAAKARGRTPTDEPTRRTNDGRFRDETPRRRPIPKIKNQGQQQMRHSINYTKIRLHRGLVRASWHGQGGTDFHFRFGARICFFWLYGCVKLRSCSVEERLGVGLIMTVHLLYDLHASTYYTAVFSNDMRRSAARLEKFTFRTWILWWEPILLRGG